MENYTEKDLQAIGSLMIKNSLRVIENPEGEGWIMYNFEKDKTVGKVYPSVTETKIGLIRDAIPTWGSKGISSMEYFLKLSGRMDDFVNNLNSTLLNQIDQMVKNKNITREQVISLMIIHQGQIKNGEIGILHGDQLFTTKRKNRWEYDNFAEYEELYPHGSNLMLGPDQMYGRSPKFLELLIR